MRILFITLNCCLFLCGCTTTKPVTFKNGNELLKAAGKIKIGDTRNNVVCHLGWRKDQGLVEESWRSKDDGGGMIHPRIAFWHWQVYPVSLYVGFTDDGQVYRIRYYDDRKTPDGPYTMIGPDLSKHTNTLAAK